MPGDGRLRARNGDAQAGTGAEGESGRVEGVLWPVARCPVVVRNNMLVV